MDNRPLDPREPREQQQAQWQVSQQPWQGQPSQYPGQPQQPWQGQPPLYPGQPQQPWQGQQPQYPGQPQQPWQGQQRILSRSTSTTLARSTIAISRSIDGAGSTEKLGRDNTPMPLSRRPWCTSFLHGTHY